MKTLANSEAGILDRVIRPDSGGWPRTAAKAILEVAFPVKDQNRMLRLMGKAKAGTLSPAEAGEMENYRHVGRLLELMKSRARRSLQPAP